MGQAILDLSKVSMFNFFYDYAKPKWGNSMSLLMTNTDSFVFAVETDDIYKDIALDVHERFDTRNYKGEPPSGMPTGVNKKVQGMFKDEMAGGIITEFIGLRAKMYATASLTGEEEKRQRGCQRVS